MRPTAPRCEVASLPTGQCEVYSCGTHTDWLGEQKNICAMHKAVAVSNEVIPMFV
jgi:hypothetical protein